eukprot:GFUD01026451.1.p1 GENE.GFUD01026451.1~~GFUD01026451.1.p1  ORF type:complete len:346 (+),score=90.25 GFUD01026451.1:73-1110(+)
MANLTLTNSSSSLTLTCTGARQDEYLTGYTIFVWTLACLIIIANVLLITVILRSPGLRTQRFNLIMISLACTDLLVGFFIPFNTIRIGRWTLGPYLCEFVTSMTVILLSASIYNFVCVNIDRLIAIKMPLKYYALKDKRWMVKAAIFACWILSLVPAVPMWTSFDTRTEKNDGTCFICSFPYKSAVWVWWSSVTAFIIPTVLIIIIWLSILLHFCKENIFTEDKKFSSGRAGRERRVTLIMGTITLAFLVCWWPYAIIFMMGFEKNSVTVLQKVVTLAYLNSLINPILYICINKQVRKAIVRLFTCQKQDDRFGSDGPQSTFSRSLSRQSTFNRQNTMDSTRALM